MNTTEAKPLITQVLKFEDAPAFGAGSLSGTKEQDFVMFAHLFPLIVWPWKRSASPAVDVHGKEALNFAITLMIIMFPLGFIAGLLGTAVATLVSALCSVASFGVLMLVLCGAFQARAGRVLRYPLNFRLIK